MKGEIMTNSKEKATRVDLTRPNPFGLDLDSANYKITSNGKKILDDILAGTMDLRNYDPEKPCCEKPEVVAGFSRCMFCHEPDFFYCKNCGARFYGCHCDDGSTTREV